MNFRPSARTATSLLALALAGLAPVAAQAETTDSPWEYSASIYLWLPAISGDTSFPSRSGGGGGDSSIDVSSEDVVMTDGLEASRRGLGAASPTLI